MYFTKERIERRGESELGAANPNAKQTAHLHTLHKHRQKHSTEFVAVRYNDIAIYTIPIYTIMLEYAWCARNDMMTHSRRMNETRCQRTGIPEIKGLCVDKI